MNRRQKLKKLKRENENLRNLLDVRRTLHIPLFPDRRVFTQYKAIKRLPRELYCDEVIALSKKELARMLAEQIEEEMDFNICDEGCYVLLEARIFIGRKLGG